MTEHTYGGPRQQSDQTAAARLERDAPAPDRHRNMTALLGGVGVLLLVTLGLMALLAPVLSQYDPQLSSSLPNLAPSVDHLLGTNDLGQDIFSRLIHGARLSLSIGLLSALFAVGLGLAGALLAGYYRGSADAVLMRAVDITLALPLIPLVIVLAAFLGRGLITTVLVIAAVIWARPARILRSQVLKIREFQHVEAARAMGSSPLRTMTQHILPRAAPLAAAQFVRAANVAVMIEASLAFLGLGDPQRVSWGTMLFFANSSSAMLTDAWLWWILPPGLALTAAILGFAFIGYAVEEWGDRRLRGEGAVAPRGRRGSTAATEDAAVSQGMTTPPGSALVVDRLTVVYESAAGPACAVDDVSFAVRKGSVVGLVGESGCGKTTLAMTVGGLSRAPARITSGAVMLAETGPTVTSIGGRGRGRRVAVVPQYSMNALNPAYTVHRQIAEAAALTYASNEVEHRANELLELVGLAPADGAAYPHQLSGGMRQRVVLAMALANTPALLVADEPLTGLDVVTQDKILHLLLDLQGRLGVAVLLISHDLPLVGSVVDDLLVMYAGKIVESGPAPHVVASPRHPYTRELLRSFPSLEGPVGELATLPGQPPDIRKLPAGCRFHPRCPAAVSECRELEPSLVERGPSHRIACLLEGD